MKILADSKIHFTISNGGIELFTKWEKKSYLLLWKEKDKKYFKWWIWLLKDNTIGTGENACLPACPTSQKRIIVFFGHKYNLVWYKSFFSMEKHIENINKPTIVAL